MEREWVRLLKPAPFYSVLIKRGFSLSLFLHFLCLGHEFNESEDGLGFSGYDKILHELSPFLASSSTILII